MRVDTASDTEVVLHAYLEWGAALADRLNGHGRHRRSVRGPHGYVLVAGNTQLGEHGELVRSFAVDFVGQAENFVPDEMRSTPDTPYVHEAAALAGTDHEDIVLSSDQLAGPEVRAKVVRARDLPNGMGAATADVLRLAQLTSANWVDLMNEV